MNAKGPEGITPLHDAAQYRSIGVFKYLVEKGADLYAADSDGHTCV